jgi:hypothetical protein
LAIGQRQADQTNIISMKGNDEDYRISRERSFIRSFGRSGLWFGEGLSDYLTIRKRTAVAVFS